MSDPAVELIRAAAGQYVWPAVGVVVTFALAVLLHEFGHFVFARLSGVGIEIFSIGFGKRLWGVRRGGTDYRISAFPLGGYVKMRGVFSKETERYLEGEEEGKEKAAPSDGESGESEVAKSAESSKAIPATTGLRLAQEAIEDSNALRGKPWLIRVLVFAAGCGFNFLVAVAAFALIAWRGVEQDAPYPSIVGPIKEATPLYNSGLRRGDRIVEFAGRLVAAWERNFQNQPPGVFDILDEVLRDETVWQVNCVVVRREDDRQTTHSLVLPAREIFPAWRNQQIRHLIAPAYIGGVMPFSPAHKAGIRAGDIVRAIDGRAIESYDEMTEIVQASPGKPLTFQVQRRGENIALLVTPVERSTSPSLGMIGVNSGNVEREWFKVGFFRAWQVGFWKAVHTTRDVAVGTLGLFARFRISEMKQNLAGPLGIFGMTYESARQGWAAFMFNMAILNIALLVLNILPIPILDGGHILITTVEAVTRRPMPPRMLAGIYYVFLALILSLFIMVTWFDVLRFASWLSPNQ